MTVAAFAKGLLAVEGELTPIFVQMVKSANIISLLDSDSDSVSNCQQHVKVRYEILQKDRDFTPKDYEKFTPSRSIYVIKSMHLITNPLKTCDKIYFLIQSLTSQIRHRMEDPKSADIQLYHSETLELMLHRWSKLEKDIKRKTVNKLHPVYSRGVLFPERHIRTRLYFTSESHVHSLLSILHYGAIYDESKDEQLKRGVDYLHVVNELNYMMQIVIMLYEDPNKDLSSEECFHVELHFNLGAKGYEENKNLQSVYGYRPTSRENGGRRSLRIDDDESHNSKRDEVNWAMMLFKPLVSEPIHIHRK